MNLKNVLPFYVLTIGLLDTVVSQSVVCPAVRTTSGWLDLFPLPCRKHAECRVMGTQHLCCKGYCTKGVKPTAQLRADQQKSSVADSSSTSTSTSTSTTSSTTTTTTTSTTTTTTPSTTSSSPTTPRPRTEPPRPFLQILPILSTKAPTQRNAPATATARPAKTGFDLAEVDYSLSRNTESVSVSSNVYSSAGKAQKFVCPKAGSAPVLLFPIPCENNSQCRATGGPDQVCCDKRCVKGVPAPRPTSKPQTHQPILGVIPRECPATPLGELLFEVQTCKSDADCWPRVCCPDGNRSYCRTARARLDLVPVANQIDGPVRMFEQYLQCTKPPQLDLFPQRCTSSVDCFPNLCCAEGGKKHCRPPQRSLIALLAGVTQRVGSTIVNFRQAAANSNNNKS